MSDCRIEEIITGREEVLQAEKHIAFIRGETPRRLRQSVKYKNTQNGDEYLALYGAIAWPGYKPGYALVVAVANTKSDPVPFRLLAEVEEKNTEALLRAAFDLYEQYGANCKQVGWIWYGDPDNGLIQFLLKINNEQRKMKETEHFLAYPPHYEEANRFEIYAHIIGLLLRQKRLDLGNCDRVKAYLQNLNEADIHATTAEYFPAVAALGYVITALYEYEPWKSYIEEDVDLVSYEKHALHELEEQEKYMDAMIEEVDEPLFEGEVINTVD